MRSISCLAAMLLMLLASLAQAGEPANQTVKVFVFSSEGCPHCKAELQFLEQIKPNYPELQVYDYEVGKYQSLFDEFGKRYNVSTRYVPVTFIGDSAVMGFDGKDSIGKTIEANIRRQIDILYNRTTEETLPPQPVKPAQTTAFEGLTITEYLIPVAILLPALAVWLYAASRIEAK